VSPSAVGMLTNSGWTTIPEVLFASKTNAAGTGIASVVVQFGPFAPMNDVFPKSVLPCMVKPAAEPTAIAYPNAPVRRLSRIVPFWFRSQPYWSPNQVRGPTAMPILRVCSAACHVAKALGVLDHDLVRVGPVLLAGLRLLIGEFADDSVVSDDGAFRKGRDEL
jgi:hypothetical protein